MVFGAQNFTVSCSELCTMKLYHQWCGLWILYYQITLLIIQTCTRTGKAVCLCCIQPIWGCCATAGQRKTFFPLSQLGFTPQTSVAHIQAGQSCLALLCVAWGWGLDPSQCRVPVLLPIPWLPHPPPSLCAPSATNHLLGLVVQEMASTTPYTGLYS